MLTIADILTAARSARPEAVRALCAGLSNDDLRAEIGRRAENVDTLARCEQDTRFPGAAERYRVRLLDARQALAALEAERGQRPLRAPESE